MNLLRNYCIYLIPDYLEQDGYDSPMRIIQLNLCSLIQLLIYISYNFHKKLQKKSKLILFVVQFKGRRPHSKLLHMTIKKPPRVKGPRRPTEPKDLLYFETDARLRQHAKRFCPLPNGPSLENATEAINILACPSGICSNIRQHPLEKQFSCKLEELRLPLRPMMLL